MSWKSSKFVSGVALAMMTMVILAGVASAAPTSLGNSVRHELVMLPYYGVFDNLAYRVEGNTVTLYGQVTRPTLKSDAGRVVKQLEGVEQESIRLKCYRYRLMTTGSAWRPTVRSLGQGDCTATPWAQIGPYHRG